MPKPESVKENKTHKILWDFETQTDHQILAKRPDLVLINNSNNSSKKELVTSSKFCRSGEP